MKPVDQTQLAELLPDGTRSRHGNCLMASVASILEVPLDTLPVLDDSHDDGSWFTVLCEATRRHGFVTLYAENNPAFVPPGYHIACGLSPRGKYGHAVVALDGSVTHDPHPSRSGILSIDRWLLLYPLASPPPAEEPDCTFCGGAHWLAECSYAPSATETPEGS